MTLYLMEMILLGLGAVQLLTLVLRWNRTSLALTIGGESRVVTGSEQLDVHLELKSRIAAREISPLLLMQTKQD